MLPFGRTMKAAHQAGITLPADEVVKAGELVQASFARGAAPSAAARKVFALLIQAAAGDAWKPGPHSIRKRDLRGSHRSNDRLDDIFDELQRTLLRVETVAPDGRAAVMVSPVIAYRIEHPDDDDRALIWWEFSESARRVMQGSDYYARLNRGVLLAFDSRYAVTLYERACLLVGRTHGRKWRGSVTELREMMGIPSDAYRDWTDLRNNVVNRAVGEVNQLTDINVRCSTEQGPRRKVTAIELVFSPKSRADRDAAAAELERSRVGRKARRAAGPVWNGISPETAEALQALREGRDPQ